VVDQRAAERAGSRPLRLTFWTPSIFQYDKNFPIAERVLHVDVAVTVGQDSDYTVLALAGRDPSMRRALIERAAWGRWPAPEIRQRIHEFCDSVDRKPLAHAACGTPGRMPPSRKSCVAGRAGATTMCRTLSPARWAGVSAHRGR
jgi:hypothetical protein